jgi:hypothetical protein
VLHPLEVSLATGRVATQISLAKAHAQEKCITDAKVCDRRKTAKLIDLLWDSERGESLSDHGGGVPVAGTWPDVSFLPHEI